MFRINLQFFGTGMTPDEGGADNTDYTGTGDGSTGAEDVDEGQSETEDSSEEDGDKGEAGEEDEGKEDPKKVEKPSEPDDNTPWVKKRLARAERAYERKFMEEVNGASYGHEVPRADLPKAAALWNMLRANPELSSKLNQMINEEVKSGKAKSLDNIQPTSGYDARESRLALREAKLDMRESDPVFRKYEQDILEWAEDEGLRIRSDRDLKSAVREWKGAHARTLGATQPPAKKQATPPAKVPPAGPTGAKSKGGTPPPNYRKMSAEEIIKHDGLKLLSDD